MHIQTVAEYEISSDTHQLINRLLMQSFPNYPSDRIYYKQLPQFRYLVWENENLLAQLGIEHRAIANAGALMRIFGLIDLCVAPQWRSQKIATTLLQQVEQLGQASNIDFLILFADDHRLYAENGYCRVANLCRWMMIDEHQTLGIAEKSLADCMMVKQIGTQPWQDGTVDLLGYLF
jgi:GNAT superfamily N-acetyltransferase